MNFIRRFFDKQALSEIRHIEHCLSLMTRGCGMRTIEIIRINKQLVELEKRNEYLQRLNACYAADRQQMMADKDPFYAERNFPRVTKFLNRTKK